MAESVRRILVVDDEENTRIGLTKLLSQEGFEVSSVANGYEALESLGRQKVGLIISDINMPEMDGIEFLQELGRRHPGISVVMITAYGGVESYLEVMNLGAYEYLHKPVRLVELRSIINKVFGDQALASVQ